MQISDENAMMRYLKQRIEMTTALQEIRHVETPTSTGLLLDIDNGTRYKVTIEQVKPARAQFDGEQATAPQRVAIRSIGAGLPYPVDDLCIDLFETPVGCLRRQAASTLISALVALQFLSTRQDEFINIDDIHRRLQAHNDGMRMPALQRLMQRLQRIGAVYQDGIMYKFKHSLERGDK